ncbi:hypothetical protein B6U67_04510, partial [Methanosarcinales archaeon ex4484_138]
AHLGEAHRAMVVACGVLAAIIIVFGIFGLSLEHLLGKGFGHTLEQLHLPVEAIEHSMPHLLVPILSVLSVAIGIVPAYLLYFSGKVDPAGIVEKYAVIRVFHNFFWNRWYIDSFYYMFFVGGITKLYTFVPKYIEEPLDKVFHVILPAIPGRLSDLVKHTQLERGLLASNLIYVLLFYIFVLLLILVVVMT